MRRTVAWTTLVGMLAAALALGSVALAENGVGDDEVLLGEAAAFSGPSAGLGVEMWRGASVAFAAANDRGGVHGRKVKLIVADDGYDAERAAPAVATLVVKEKVFALFGGVGTPTIVKALPVVLKYHLKDDLFYFASFTGAQTQREAPYDKAVFNVRASYRQETRAAIDAFVAMGRKKVGIFVQDDSYGTSGRDGAQRALKDHDLKLAAETMYPRGAPKESSMAAQVKILHEAGCDAVISVGAYQACAAFIRDARTSGWDVPILNLSFVGADQLLRILLDESKASGAKLLANLLITQVVPSYEDETVPVVKEYRAAMAKYQPKTPPGVGDGSYTPNAVHSYGSLEGYVSARAFLAVLEKTGRKLDRKAFYAAAEAMGKFDLGVGADAELSTTRHQILDRVWFTYATEDGWRATDAPASVIK